MQRVARKPFSCSPLASSISKQPQASHCHSSLKHHLLPFHHTPDTTLFPLSAQQRNTTNETRPETSAAEASRADGKILRGMRDRLDTYSCTRAKCLRGSLPTQTKPSRQPPPLRRRPRHLPERIRSPVVQCAVKAMHDQFHPHSIILRRIGSLG